MRPGETTRSITLKGTPAAVAELKIKIEETLNGGASAKPMQTSSLGSELPHAYVIKIPVPNDKVGIIIGRGGMTVKSIQEKSRAHVQIPAAPDEDNPAVRTISVGADTKEQADCAQLEIFMVLQQQAHSHAPSVQNSLNILVPDDKVGIIIGRQGSTIKDIQQRCQVKVQIPQTADPGSNPPVRTCSIVGTPEAQYIARYEIEAILGLAPGGPQYNSSVAPQVAVGYYNPSQAAVSYGQYGTHAYGGSDPYYAAAYQQQQQAAAYAATPATEVPSDPTAYYGDFWTYASYYGEAAARVYYQAWSPPEGTPPPAGMVVAGAATADSTQPAAAAEVKEADSAGVNDATAAVDSTVTGDAQVNLSAILSSDAYVLMYSRRAYGRPIGSSTLNGGRYTAKKAAPRRNPPLRTAHRSTEFKWTFTGPLR
jgi:far upstream element-binding protein